MEQSSKFHLEDYMPMLYAMGFPTFDDFKKNPDKWRKRPDELLISADGSTQTFRAQVERQRYTWRKVYSFGSLEQIERVAKDEGYSTSDLEMEPEVKPLYGTSKQGKVEIVIHFWPKDEWARKGKIVSDG